MMAVQFAVGILFADNAISFADALFYEYAK